MPSIRTSKRLPSTAGIYGSAIPAGIDEGQKIRIAGYGSPGVNGGPAGDLFITFRIVNDTAFTRSGNDLLLTRELDLYTALLGGRS